MAPPEVATQTTATPWLATRTEEKDIEDASKLVEWYQPALKALPASTLEVFTKYVGLKSEEEVKEHIYKLRDKAWNVLPYPCIGVFRFLDFSIHLAPIYPTVVSRLRAGETLLDLGCCFGQDLRKVAFDSGSSKNLMGADIESRFMELGYELFGDASTFEAQFTSGSIFEEDFMSKWHGKIDMIYLGSFLHLFTNEQQVVIVKKLEKLLVKKPGALVFGRNLGADKGGEFRMESLGWDLYRHSDETMRDLWNLEGEWEIESQLSRYESPGWENSRRSWQGDDTKQMMFTAKRL